MLLFITRGWQSSAGTPSRWKKDLLLTLIGANRAGKSTILRAISGLTCHLRGDLVSRQENRWAATPRYCQARDRSCS